MFILTEKYTSQCSILGKQNLKLTPCVPTFSSFLLLIVHEPTSQLFFRTQNKVYTDTRA